MRKLRLVALSYDRDKILNALERTNAVEVKTHAEVENTEPLSRGGEELAAYLGRLENALGILVSRAESYAEGEKRAELVPKDGFAVSYGEFCAAAEYRARADELMAEIDALLDEKNNCAAEQLKTERLLAQAEAYRGETRPFDYYSDTKSVRFRRGTVTEAVWDGLEAELKQAQLVGYEAKTVGENVLLTVASHKSEEGADGALQAAGFVPCPFTGGETGKALYQRLTEQLAALSSRARDAEVALFGLAGEVRQLKIYCDYVGFLLEKEELSEKLRVTERTFLLEAFVPKEQEEEVKGALERTESALFYEFSDPAEDEFVPTLAKNNKVVENFEAITNMYSPPSAREIDPNAVMSFFYSVFLGFIMADIGYGLLMLLGGGFLYFKNRAKRGGIKSLAGVFAIGGMFAVIWGFLFNSLFGLQVLPKTIMPDPQNENWKFVGIDIPAMLIISMIIGIVQICAGYAMKAAQEWRRGAVLDGFCDGVVWVVFSIGMLLAIVGLTEKFALPILATAGGITAAAALVIAMLTAGRKEKLLGKFTKGFGALYGIINYMSDVLSYARLYGLMLSGAVIAQIISQYGVQFLTGGNFAFILLGAVLMVVGHLFNLAMSLLGAYIHDARLQYVEFYGRFFEGEGELFTPLGSSRKYVTVS